MNDAAAITALFMYVLAFFISFFLSLYFIITIDSLMINNWFVIFQVIMIYRLTFCVLCDGKLNLFGPWTVGQTKQTINLINLGYRKTVMSIFTNF